MPTKRQAAAAARQSAVDVREILATIDQDLQRVARVVLTKRARLELALARSGLDRLGEIMLNAFTEAAVQFELEAASEAADNTTTTH